jgi:hypothetical protein
VKRRPRVAAEAGKRRRRGLERAPVSAGVGDEQDDHVDPAVPLLAVEPALEGLEIVERGLGFDGDPPLSTLDEQVPRSQVTADGQRDLCSASETRVDVRPEAIQEPLLAHVANGIAGWICPEDEIEPDRRAPSADPRNGHVIDHATLEPEELLVRGARRRGNVTQAQPGADPSGTNVAAKDPERIVGSAPAAIRRPLPGAHPTSLTVCDLLPVIW